MMGLDLMGLSVSSGSACSSGKVGPSHVLDAMGVPAELAGCALRLSLGWSSTKDDIETYLRGFGEVVSRHFSRRGRAA
jgi:cysteine desulfurase